jgi:hypothetical protein
MNTARVTYTDGKTVELAVPAGTFPAAAAYAEQIAYEELEFNHEPGVRITMLVLEWHA